MRKKKDVWNVRVEGEMTAPAVGRPNLCNVGIVADSSHATSIPPPLLSVPNATPPPKIPPSRTPIESLPSEILSEILLLLVDHAREDRWVTTGETRTDLRLVSHLWNHIILSTPSLWTCIEIGINSIFIDSPPFSTIRLLLDRSGQLPLELDINLLTGTARWGSIDIDAWPSLHLPNLRILEIGETVILPLFHCPNLQVLSISSKPHLVALQAVSTYVSTSKHSLQVLRLQAMQRNKDLARIPILEVHTVRDEKVERDSIRREVLDRMWERFGHSRTPTLAVYGRRVTALGWVDSKVLQSFSEYFEDTRKIVLPSGTLSSY
ncbi:hypothetical protein P691DRAFT_780851 [Macrolepiota fuliginosa MF-IS2]|uniref:F-box domain-containing protein n=1 Tax=Macrolepiota fuliginosa MF-IS2 TaxID=1400762 RepID=A0A9P5X0A0_9AGAR|nr:hypothetical protein P691DRAFT_780851 [Macrolepiota fuliginosa MF-IS2]